MSSKIKQRNVGKYTCLDFPDRKARLIYDNNTKQYEVYRYTDLEADTAKVLEVNESPLWKIATLVTVGICIGMLTVLGIVLLR